MRCHALKVVSFINRRETLLEYVSKGLKKGNLLVMWSLVSL